MGLKRYLPRNLRIDSDSGPPRYIGLEIAGRLRSPLFKGNKVECSCCGRTFSLFLFSPYMTALCPYCLSIERYRLLCRWLRDETDFCETPAKLLDVAPMYCFQEFCRSTGCIDYLSLDIASPFAMFHADLRDLPFKDGVFDRITCYHVLEHIQEDHLAISELYRVMKTGGWGVIQVPIHVEKTVERAELSPEDQERILRFPNHVRAYGHQDYADRLRAGGFEVEVVDYVKRFGPEEIKRYGLDPSEDIYLCRKA